MIKYGVDFSFYPDIFGGTEDAKMRTATVEEATPNDEKKNRDRSPAFPFIGLKAAIERATEFYREEKRNAAPVSVAVKHWGYGEKSSAGNQTIAALKYFGLLRDKGSGSNRRVQLTDLGLRIVMDERAISPERDALIKQAALKPKSYALLWGQWGTAMPSEENVRHYLRVDLKFGDSTVDSFIRGYKDTVAFAKLSESDKVQPEGGVSEAPESAYVPKIGDYVQWESQGALQFKEPKRVVALSTDGSHGFVEGSSTGLPVGQLSQAPAPLSSLTASTTLSPTTNMQEDVFSLSEGRAVIQWPTPLSAESIQDLKDWLKLVERKITRSKKSKDETEK
jgi:hypothetical protein